MADGRIVIDTKVDSSGAEKGINKLSGIASKGLKGFTTTIGKTSGVIAGIMGSVGVIYNSQMEQYMAGFETMLGSADKATKHINELKEFAAKTPFEMSDLAQASTTLQAFGVDVKEVTPDLKMLGDISLGNKEKFNGLALVFGQVKSQGKLMGQDLMQMINNGFNPLLIISKKTGKSMSQLKDEMSKGKITYEMVADAMKTATSEGGMFAGAMDKQSRTMSGLISTIKDNLGALAGKVAKPLFDIVKSGLENLLPLLDNVSVAVDKMFSKMEEGKSIGQSMYKAFQGMIPENILFTITAVIDGIIFAFKGLVSFIKGDTEKARDMFYTMFPTDDIGNEKFVDIIMGVLDTVKNLFNFIIDNKDTIISAFVGIGVAMEVFKAVELVQKFIKAYKAWKIATEGMTAAQWLLNIAMGANPVGIIIAAIAGLVAGIVVLWNTNEGFRNAVTNAWNAILDAGKAVWEWLVNFFTVDIPNAWNSMIKWFAGVGEWFAELWSNIEKAFIDGWNNIASFFTETVPSWCESVKQSFIDGWNAIISFFTETIPAWIEQIFNWFNELPYKIGYALGYVLGSIVQWGVDTWNYLVTNVPIWIENVVNFFAELPGKIGTWLVETFNKIATWGINTYNNMVENVTMAINSVVTFFSELPGKIWTWLSNTISKIVTWGQQTYSNMVSAVTNAINAVINWFATLPSRIWTWLSNTISKVAQFASNLGSKAAEAGSNMVSNIVDAVADLPSQMLDVGINIVKGVWKGITSMGSWIGDKVSGFFKGIVDGAKDALGIQSPSRVFRDQVGKYMAQGVGVGFEDETENIKKDMKESLRNLTDKMRYTVDYETAKASKNITAKNNPNGNSTITNNNDNGVTQHININQPVKSPAETARALKKVGRDLAFGY